MLGPLEVQRSDAPVTIGSRSQRRLLAALAIAGGQTVSVDHLIDTLWGPDPPAAARNSLQSHVARLRATLGDGGAIVTRDPGYALDRTHVEVDAIAFEEVLARGRRELTTDPDGVAARLSSALAWWRGEAYAGFEDDRARREAERLADLRVEARCLEAEARLRAGDPGSAVAGLQRLAADEPLREDVAVRAARALAAADRPTDALTLLRTFRDRLAAELGLDPTDGFRDLEQQLLRGEHPGAPLPAGAPRDEPVGPPRVATPTVGREAELADLGRCLRRGPLVTLVGPGGVGKTRLAMVVAHARASATGERVAWVDLAHAVGDPDVPPALSEALGRAVTDTTDRAAVATALSRFRGLVVLDNCEHVLDAAADVVARALDRTSRDLVVLATSRERLDVPGEQVISVPPLPVPTPEAATAADPVVALFLDRLRSADGVPVSPAEAAAVAAAVDGLPLGIELAAARAATVPVDELLRRLRDHLDVLAGTGRRHGERQRTLVNVIAWSHALLDEPEQRVFRRLAVLAWAFRLATAVRVVADDDLPAAAVVDAVGRLVERSMLLRVGVDRYRLLQPLRLFAAEQLAASPDATVTRRRHLELVREVAARVDTELTGPGEPAAVAEIEDALPDLRAVHARAVDDGDLPTIAELTGELYRFAYAQARPDLLTWGARLAAEDADELPASVRLRAIAASVPAAVWRGHDDEAARLAARCAAALHPGAVGDDLDPWTAVTVTEVLGDLHLQRGELGEAAAAYERNVRLARTVDHPGLTSLGLSGLSICRTFQERDTEGEGLAEEAAALAEEAGAPSARSLAAYALGEALAERAPDRALEAFDTAIAEASRSRARFFEGIARTADVALRGRFGDPDEALARSHTALQVWYDAGADRMVLTALRNLVVLLARLGRDADAVTLHRALDRSAAQDSFGSEAVRLSRAVAAATERLGADAAASAERRAAAVTDLAAAARFGEASIAAAITR